MHFGVDLGNYYTKVNGCINFISKVSESADILSNTPITINNKTLYVGQGEFDTENRKAYKESYLHLLKYAIQSVSKDTHNKIVVGLPLTNYKKDKNYLINRILQSGIVDDVEVQPEGVVCLPSSYEGIGIDIGGGTTDIFLLEKEGGRRKIKNPYSIPNGILNLESEFINYINSEFGLDLVPKDADRIIKNGLYIYGEKKEFSLSIYSSFVKSIIRRVQVDYSLKTNNITLLGGGGQKLYGAFKMLLPQTELLDNSFYSNSIAFTNIARRLWN